MSSRSGPNHADSSPSKRRRKNDHTPSKAQVKGLDYFFAKQQQKQKEKLDEKEEENEEGNEIPASAGAGDSASHMSADEELARKLQEEWNRELAEEEEQRSQQQQKLSVATTVADTFGSSGGDGPDLQISAPELPQASVHLQQKQPQRPQQPQLQQQQQQQQLVNPFARPAKQTLSLQSTSTDEDTVTASIPFDTSPLHFDPSEHIPTLQTQWASLGGQATYALLTRCFVLVNSTQSRIKIVDTLVNLLRTLIEGDPASLLPAVWLATNSISPTYVSLELGLGGSALTKALKKICGLDNGGLKSLYAKHGDPGDVAYEAKKRHGQSFMLRKPKPLTIRAVFDALVRIATAKGQGSVEGKQRIVDKLIQDARGPEESRYIVRTLVQNLRIGAVKTTMLIALSRAFMLSRPPGANFPIKDITQLRSLKKEELAELYSRNEEIVKACFARHPNYNDLVPVLLEIGVCDELLLRCGLTLHIPLRPMLGSITRDLSEMLTKLQGRAFSCEFKYDGQRAQVHCDAAGKVSIFSRHLELMTDKYPDLVALVPQLRGEGVTSFIMEGEVVAIDSVTGDLRPFQTLSNRARKDVGIGSVTIDVCLFAFDLMYLNGEELLNRPFRERRDLLRSLFVEIPHRFTWVKSLDATSADSDVVLEFFKTATETKCEGIMVKVLDNNLPMRDQSPAILDQNVPDPVLADTVDAAPRTLTITTGRNKLKGAVQKSGYEQHEIISSDPKSKDTEKPDKSTGSRRKALLSTYEPDKRLDSWLKVKKDYHSAADTLDLIPVAAWHGSGRKSKWWSPILLAARNPDTGALEAVTKCMSGFSDKFYAGNRAKYDPGVGLEDDEYDDDDDDDDASEAKEEIKEDEDANPEKKEAKNNTLPSKPAFVEYTGGSPDVWFVPQEVWECAFADITLSPTYTAALGLVSDERGLSLRFPRFVRVREDKSIDEASEVGYLADLYRKQEARAPSSSTVPTTSGTSVKPKRAHDEGLDDDEDMSEAEEENEEHGDKEMG